MKSHLPFQKHQAGGRENLQGVCGEALNLGKYKPGKRERQPNRKDQRETVPSTVSLHDILPSQEGQEKKKKHNCEKCDRTVKII